MHTVKNENGTARVQLMKTCPSHSAEGKKKVYNVYRGDRMFRVTVSYPHNKISWLVQELDEYGKETIVKDEKAVNIISSFITSCYHW